MAVFKLTSIFRTPHPRRLELWLPNGVNGPLVNPYLGEFNPIRDIKIYADGYPIRVLSSRWDAPNSRYILFLDNDLSNGEIQVLHHIPEIPFTDFVNPIPVLFYADSNIVMSLSDLPVLSLDHPLYGECNSTISSECGELDTNIMMGAIGLGSVSTDADLTGGT